MTRVRIAWLALALGGVCVACERTPQEAHDDAIEAQRSANQEIRSAEQTAAEQAAEARREADKAIAERDQKVEEANRDAREEAAKAQAEANDTIREANKDVNAPARTELRTWAQGKVDVLSNEIDEATAKAQKASADARTRFESDMREVRKSRDEILAELAKIEARSNDKAADFRASLDERVERLKVRVRELERNL